MTKADKLTSWVIILAIVVTGELLMILSLFGRMDALSHKIDDAEIVREKPVYYFFRAGGWESIDPGTYSPDSFNLWGTSVQPEMVPFEECNIGATGCE